MNKKRILFSAIVTAIIGFVIGLGVAKVGQPDETRLRYETATNRQLFRQYGFFGIGIGFFFGAGQEYLRQAKKQRDKEN
jgi:H+/Cl- antiporter ClcA